MQRTIISPDTQSLLRSDTYRQARLTTVILLTPFLAFLGTLFWYGFFVSPYIDSVTLDNSNPPGWPYWLPDALSMGFLPALVCLPVSIGAFWLGIRYRYPYLWFSSFWALAGMFLIAGFYMIVTF